VKESSEIGINGAWNWANNQIQIIASNATRSKKGMKYFIIAERAASYPISLHLAFSEVPLDGLERVVG